MRIKFLLLLLMGILLCLNTSCDPEIFTEIRTLNFKHRIVPANTHQDTIQNRAVNFPESLDAGSNTFIAILPEATSPTFNRVQITGDPTTIRSSILIRRNNEASVNGVTGILIEAIGPIEVGRTIENVRIEVFTGMAQDASIYSSGSNAGVRRFGELTLIEYDTENKIIAGEFAAYGQDIVNTDNLDAMVVFDGTFRLSYE